MFYRFLFLLALFISFDKPLSAQNKTEAVKTAFEMIETESFVPAQASFKDKYGQDVFLSSFQGKIIVLNFFKPTCRPCLIELPGLNQLAETLKDMSVIILAVAEGEETADIVEKVFHERRLNNLSVALDQNGNLLKALGGEKVPRTLLINAEGKIIGALQGQADFTSPILLKQIKDAF